MQNQQKDSHDLNNDIESKIYHLNGMLAGIRNVNRLINKTTSPEKLLDGICESLVGQIGYLACWGALFDLEASKAFFIKNIGFDNKRFSKFSRNLQKGILPECAECDFKNNEIHSTHLVQQLDSCLTCPMRVQDGSIFCGTLTVPIYVKGLLYAMLGISLPNQFSNDKEMLDLFSEVALDISNAFEKIELDKELLHYKKERFKVEKFNSLTTMAGGIAHDFNNLLVGILGNIALAKLELTPDNSIYEYLESAELASRRGRGLTQRLFTFAKGGSPIIDVIDIKLLVKESVSFLFRDSHINVDISADADLHYVAGDDSQLNQVINNLLLNASEAMQGGGDIKVKLQNIRLPLKKQLITAAAEREHSQFQGDYIAITITDSGYGMDEATMDKIFDPYFSTKKAGTGLGLSSVFSIIKSHHGSIHAESIIDQGSTFTIYLPRSTKLQSNTVVNKNNKFSLLTNKHILIMDDEEVVRKVLSTFLKSFKSRITATDCGEDAIKVYKQHILEDPFDIVIVDLNVPNKMGGVETAKELLKIDPKANIILSTGYSDDDASKNYNKYGFKASLNKPYTIEELKNVLEKISSM